MQYTMGRSLPFLHAIRIPFHYYFFSKVSSPPLLVKVKDDVFIWRLEGQDVVLAGNKKGRERSEREIIVV